MREQNPMDGRVATELGADFYNGLSEEITASGCDHTQRQARTLLLARDIEPADVEEFLTYFKRHGGCCSCEILMNCDYLFTKDL